MTRKKKSTKPKAQPTNLKDDKVEDTFSKHSRVTSIPTRENMSEDRNLRYSRFRDRAASTQTTFNVQDMTTKMPTPIVRKHSGLKIMKITRSTDTPSSVQSPTIIQAMQSMEGLHTLNKESLVAVESKHDNIVSESQQIPRRRSLRLAQSTEEPKINSVQNDSSKTNRKEKVDEKIIENVVSDPITKHVVESCESAAIEDDSLSPLEKTQEVKTCSGFDIRTGTDIPLTAETDVATSAVDIDVHVEDDAIDASTDIHVEDDAFDTSTDAHVVVDTSDDADAHVNTTVDAETDINTVIHVNDSINVSDSDVADIADISTDTSLDLDTEVIIPSIIRKSSIKPSLNLRKESLSTATPLPAKRPSLICHQMSPTNPNYGASPKRIRSTVQNTPLKSPSTFQRLPSTPGTLDTSTANCHNTSLASAIEQLFDQSSRVMGMDEADSDQENQPTLDSDFDISDDGGNYSDLDTLMFPKLSGRNGIPSDISFSLDESDDVSSFRREPVVIGCLPFQKKLLQASKKHKYNK